MTPQEAYVRQILPYAEQQAQRLGVHPAAIIGQMALETKWGQSILKGTNNHGNIMELRKGVNGVYANDNGNHRKFRIFANDQDFFNHFGGLMERKYKGVIGKLDPYQYGLALKRGGYAENPNYASDVAKMYNAVVKRLPQGYKWNGKATTPIPVQQTTTGNDTVQAMAGGGSYPEPSYTKPLFSMADGQVRESGPTVLGQSMAGNAGGAGQTFLDPSNNGLEFLNALTGQSQYKNSFWRS